MTAVHLAALALVLAPLPAVAQSVEGLVGRWGVASYWTPADKAKARGWAKQSCGQPYVIEKSASGNLMMFVADGQKREVALKGKKLTPVDKKLPEGPARRHVRTITALAPGSFELTWEDKGFAGRYGTVVYVKCGG
jgi:hypothetical protein